MMNRALLPFSRLTVVKLLLLALTLGASLCSLMHAHASGSGNDANKTADVDRYNQEISKNYDLKFGANPFAPSNATTTTGKFIPAEMFVAATRCAKCHTDAHAQ